MNRATVAMAIVVATLAACEQKPKTEPPAPSAQPAPMVRTMPANPSTEQDELERIVVSEDFEEQATSEITADNLDSQLANLEKELD